MLDNLHKANCGWCFGFGVSSSSYFHLQGDEEAARGICSFFARHSSSHVLEPEPTLEAFLLVICVFRRFSSLAFLLHTEPLMEPVQGTRNQTVRLERG